MPETLPTPDTNVEFTILLDEPLYARAELYVPPGGLFLENLNAYITGVGQQVMGIHAENQECHERGCSVHAPSDHAMRELKTLWRGDRGLMERICEHGVGHPDPDHMSFLQSLVAQDRLDQSTVDAEGVHGCDGCCVDPETWEQMMEENRRRNEAMDALRAEEQARLDEAMQLDRDQLEEELNAIEKRRRALIEAMGVKDQAALDAEGYVAPEDLPEDAPEVS